MPFSRTLADSYEGKTFFDIFVKSSKDVKKMSYKIVSKGAILLKTNGNGFEESIKIPESSKINIMSNRLQSIR